MTQFLENFSALPLNLGMAIKSIFDNIVAADMLDTLCYIFVPFITYGVFAAVIQIFKFRSNKLI